MDTAGKIKIYIVTVLALSLLFIAAGSTAGEYASLQGLDTIKAVFDVRSKNVDTAALQLDLIHQTYHDQYIRNVTDHPEMTIVIGGAAVRMVSSDKDDFSEEETILLGLMEGKIATMIRDGIRFEICLFAADIFDVEPETILPGIHHVGNGWISLIGYQARGYSLVAAF